MKKSENLEVKKNTVLIVGALLCSTLLGIGIYKKWDLVKKVFVKDGDNKDIDEEVVDSVGDELVPNTSGDEEVIRKSAFKPIISEVSKSSTTHMLDVLIEENEKNRIAKVE